MTNSEDRTIVRRLKRLSNVEPSQETTDRAVERARAALTNLSHEIAANPEAIRPSRQSLMAKREAVSTPARRRRVMGRAILFAAVSAALVFVWLGVPHLISDDLNSSAFAQTLTQIEKAKTITWKTTYYSHMTSKDGERTWLRTEKHEHAFKAPGLYRDTCFDQDGQIWSVEILDSVNRKKLKAFPGTNQATLSEPWAVADPKGPFDWVTKELESTDLQWVETRQTDSGEVNVFRRAFRDEWTGKDRSLDIWINQKTKQLVRVYSPGTDFYDPDKDLARNIPPEKEYFDLRGPLGCVWHDIVFDANVDDSLFRLEPAGGASVKTEPRGRVTEKEMIEYLGILAEFNGATFPDEPWITAEQANKVWDKPEQDRTPAERKFIETQGLYINKFQRMPNVVFIEDQAMEKSFRYLGKGVKLGNKDRIVCWYRRKGAPTYRVVYGDLRVRDVAPDDLPLPVER
jgi:hypothetical protein